jgi:hypothetical protein
MLKGLDLEVCQSDDFGSGLCVDFAAPLVCCVERREINQGLRSQGSPFASLRVALGYSHAVPLGPETAPGEIRAPGPGLRS